MSFNILALASVFIFYPQFRGRFHHLILEPYAICALLRVTFLGFCFVAEKLQKEAKEVCLKILHSLVPGLPSLSGC